MYDSTWIEEIEVNEFAIKEHAKQIVDKSSKLWKILERLILLKIITVIDLTTLAGDDTVSNVSALVNKAICPISTTVVGEIHKIIVENIQTILSLNVSDFTSNSEANVQMDGTKLFYEDVVELKSLLKMLGFKSENVSVDLFKFLSMENNTERENVDLNVASICVYPKLVPVVKDKLEEKNINSNKAITRNENSISRKMFSLPITSVAAGFPTGQYDIDSKISEINFAIRSGANEIDIVISRSLVIENRWKDLFIEIQTLKEACGNVKMKTILAVGECASLQNIYTASIVAMMAGSDYIKTSTGKEIVNATLPVGIVMCRAIRDFYIKTNKKVGFKPAGAIKTSKDALQWCTLIITELGVEWLSYFRIGASSILDEIDKRLKELSSRPSMTMNFFK